MSRPRLGMPATVRQTIRLYQAARALRKASGPAAYAAPKSHLHPLDADAPLDVAMSHSFARWVTMWDREINGGGPRKLPTADKISAARKLQTKRVLADVGLDATAVAFQHGLTTEGVANLRTKHGLDPGTGEKVAT